MRAFTNEERAEIESVAAILESKLDASTTERREDKVIETIDFLRYLLRVIKPIDAASPLIPAQLDDAKQALEDGRPVVFGIDELSSESTNYTRAYLEQSLEDAREAEFERWLGDDYVIKYREFREQFTRLLSSIQTAMACSAPDALFEQAVGYVKSNFVELMMERMKWATARVRFEQRRLDPIFVKSPYR